METSRVSCCVCLNGRLKTIAVDHKDSIKDLLLLMKCDSRSYLAYSIPVVFLWAGLPHATKDHAPLPITDPLSVVAKSGHVIVILKSCDTQRSFINGLTDLCYTTPITNKSHDYGRSDAVCHVTPTDRSHDQCMITDVTPTPMSYDSDVLIDSCHVTPRNKSNDKETRSMHTRRSKRIQLCANSINEPIIISDGTEDHENRNEDCCIIESPQSDDSFTIREFTITKQDMRTLLPGNWLNDKVINSYMKLLMDRYKDKVYITSSFFYTKLSTHGFNGIIRWLKKVRLLDYVYVIIPVHLNGNHWTLLCLDIRNKLMGYYDSMGCKGEKVVKSVKKMMYRYMKSMCDTKDSEAINNKNWKALYVKIPVQHNGNDCGVFMCQYARYVCENIGKRFEAMPHFSSKKIRLKMTSELRNKSLL